MKLANIDSSLVLDQFFFELRNVGEGILLLDYDGTLAAFVADRMSARPPPEIALEIARIEAGGSTRVVFVTGRPCRELVEVSGFTHPMEIWGSHGREYLDRAGRLSIVGVSEKSEKLLSQAAVATEALLSSGKHSSAFVERKSGCIALHWRSVPPEHIAGLDRQVRLLWTAFAEAGELLLKHFDGGLELCSPGRTKGDAVEDLLRRYRGIPAAFLGDDLTDEDGFRVLRGKGLCVLVRNEPRETLADIRITMPAGILAFLRRWRTAFDMGARP